MDTPTMSSHWLPCTSPLTSPPYAPNANASEDLPLLPASPRPLARPLSLSMKTCPTDKSSAPKSATSPLTPPTTPEKPADKRTSYGSDGIETLIGSPNILTLDGSLGSKETDIKKRQLSEVPDEPRIFYKKYERQGELGHGVWSIVYRAIEKNEASKLTNLLPPSPPTSPETKGQGHNPRVFAVKVPSRRDAQKILKKEARILTYLHSHPYSTTQYLVPFHGFDPTAHGIVMDSISPSLETYVKATPRLPFSTSTMFDPIIGAEAWASVASRLIDGLMFLHGTNCVHGDIKPANILLRTDEASATITPLYCDFSSARVFSPIPRAGEKEEEISAVTADYTSPELLSAFYHRNDDLALANPPSDVFALGVTLLFAAIGESPYVTARMELQKLSMAKEGQPIDFARRGTEGSRVMRGRAVARVVEGALVRSAEARVGVEAWRGVVREVVEKWEAGGWAKGGVNM